MSGIFLKGTGGGIMSRPLRIQYAGALYHITARGNRRAQIFVDDEDGKAFLKILAEVNRRFETRCHAYCLMGNHYHLLMETCRANLSLAMRQLNGVYTQTFNLVHRKVGHLFQGRYKAVLIEKDAHFLEASRYVALNPVRAGLVSRPEDWTWSSYGATIGLAKGEDCLTTGYLLGQYGETPGNAIAMYRKFVADAPDGRFRDKVVSGMGYGGEDFAARCRLQAKGEGGMAEIPRAQRFIGRPGLAEILARPLKTAENVVEAVEVHGYTQKAVADELGVHYSTVSKMLSRRMSKFKT